MSKKKPAPDQSEVVDATTDFAIDEASEATPTPQKKAAKAQTRRVHELKPSPASHKAMPASKSGAPQKRTYTATQAKDHDLYKCEVAKFLRDLSWQKDGSMRQEVEHCHFFHTIDSAGRPQETTNAVGNHFHEVTIIPAQNEGELDEVICGPAMTWEIQGKGRMKKRVMVAPRVAVNTDNEEIDEHTHEMSYQGSQRIQLRKPNIEAAKLQAEIAARQDIKVDGIRG
jgi:hypothetical protein